MQSLSVVIFLSLSVISVTARGQGALPLEVAVERPAGTGLPELLTVDLDRARAGLVAGGEPARLLVEPARDARELRVSRGQDTLVEARLFIGERGAQKVSATTPPCTGLKVAARIEGGRRLVLGLRQGGADTCKRTAKLFGTNPPRVKLRFESAPGEAELFYPQKGELASFGRTPQTTSIEFAASSQAEAVFKKAGHADCIQRLTMESDRQGMWLLLGDRRQGVSPDGEAAVVRCELRALGGK